MTCLSRGCLKSSASRSRNVREAARHTKRLNLCFRNPVIGGLILQLRTDGEKQSEAIEQEDEETCFVSHHTPTLAHINFFFNISIHLFGSSYNWGIDLFSLKERKKKKQEKNYVIRYTLLSYIILSLIFAKYYIFYY